MRIQRLFISGVLLFSAGLLYAQDSRFGTLSGSFETNTIYYQPDNKSGATVPKDRFGSNNYLKFDYRIGKFSAGLMYEAYLPALQGFPGQLKDSDIVLKYAAFDDGNLNVLAGDFYEQFGSGLIFRAYEERTLGLNTSIEGVRGMYAYEDKVRLKALWGRPRFYMERSSAQVRGADLSLSLSSLLGVRSFGLSVEGGYVSRYEQYTGTRDDIDASVDAYSARVYIDWEGFSLKGEYAEKTPDLALYNSYAPSKGKALLVEVGYVGGGFGGLITARRLETMDFRSTRESSGTCEGLNYLPALTRQYNYTLTSLNPYTTQANGEIGGQVDLYYNFPRGSALGGKYGMKVALNFSTYYDLKGDLVDGYDMFAIGKVLLFRDLNLDIVKTWNGSFKTTLLYSMQAFNPLVTGHPSEEWTSNIAVADATWKLNRRHSLRFELQHLWTKDDQKNWVAAQVEYNIAPRWSFFVSDMFNYGDTDLHYYSGGFSYSQSRTRVALNYGRSRAGYTCAGGVCRLIPAYTGLNLTLTTSF